MGILNLPVRGETCLRSLLWFALQLMLLLRLRLMPRLMLDFSMGDMDMVLVWDMLVLDIEVLAMLDTDMVSQLMDTPDLDITARDLLMLKLSLKQRLMLDFSMEDMDMVLVLDMQV